MSMRDYGVNDYGLIVTKETMKLLASKAIEEFTEEDYEEDSGYYAYELYEQGTIEYISEFTGESMEIGDDGGNLWGSGEIYNGDSIYYAPAWEEGTIFKAAYNNIEELISEFKERLGEYLPDDFDYRTHIRHIVGTYYG